jgi:Kef-type K+ transport system membrane component KefB
MTILLLSIHSPCNNFATISLVAKFLTVFISARVQGYGNSIALAAGFGLSSSGELASVLAKRGTDIGVTSSFLLAMIGTMTIITTFITPYMTKLRRKFSGMIASKIAMLFFSVCRHKKRKTRILDFSIKISKYEDNR